MREIKFRAWDLNDKIMFYHNINHHSWIYVIANKGTKEYPNILQQGHIGYFIGSNFPIMQYIGLKDKKGNKVYEGDIVIHKNNKKEKLIVQYSQAYPGYCLIEENEYEFIPSIEDWDCLEVVGNIYENFELLNTNNNKK